MLTIQDVRALKGAALSILILGLLDPQPHSAAWYARRSGYSDKPVTQALRLLVEDGYMLQTHQGWIVSRDRQPALSTELSTSYPQVGQGNRKNSDSSLNSSSSSPTNPSSFLFKEEEERTSEKFRSCLKTCEDCGIRGYKAKAIAALDHVTPEYIQAHVDAALAESHTIGTAISRIEQKWDVPEIKKQEQRDRYRNDRYAGFYD